MSKTVYLNIRQITAVRHKEIQLKDVADVYCDDTSTMNKCNALRIKTIHLNRDNKYIESTMDVIKKMMEMDSSLKINNIGEVDFIIDYQKPKNFPWLLEWIKTICVCLICFCGAAFAIMTFNNDVDVSGVFGEFYLSIMGQESDGFTILEICYSIGLAIGIIGFFNHFSKIKFTNDPTPLEVEMRLYEEDVSKTLIQNSERKESDIDVS